MSSLYRIDYQSDGSGFYVQDIAGQTLGKHKLVYRGAAGTWLLADADAVTSMPVIGLTLEVIPIGLVGRILISGYVSDIAWSWAVGGSAGQIYASQTAGELTQTAPLNNVQVIAISMSATSIMFNASSGSGGAGAVFDPEHTASYIVWVDGATYYAKDGSTGAVTSNADFSTLMNTVNGHVVIKPGNFITNSPIVPSYGEWIQGSGQYHATNIINNFNGNTFSVWNAGAVAEADITISDLSISSPSGTYTTGTSIYMEKQSRVVLRNLLIKNTGAQMGVYLDGGWNNDLNNVWVENGSGICFAINASHTSMIKCVSDGGDKSVYVAAGGSYLQASNCHFEGSISTSIDCSGDHPTFTGIKIINAGAIGLALTASAVNPSVNGGIIYHSVNAQIDTSAPNSIINGVEIVAAATDSSVKIRASAINSIISSNNIYSNGTWNAGILNYANNINIANNICVNGVGTDPTIEFSGTPTNVNIQANNLSGPIVGTLTGAGNIIRENIGFVTENSGTATITAAATSIAVTHGLSYTPSALDVSVVLTNLPTTPIGDIYVDTFTSTQFTIHCTSVPGVATAIFAWHVNKTP